MSNVRKNRKVGKNPRIGEGKTKGSTRKGKPNGEATPTEGRGFSLKSKNKY